MPSDLWPPWLTISLDLDTDVLLAELAAMPTVDDDELDADAIRTAWAGNTIEEKRQVIGLFIERVTIAPYRGGLRYPVDTSRITIHGPGWS